MEKLGIEKSQLIDELQTEYSRLIARQHQHALMKTGSETHSKMILTNEIEQVKIQLDALLEEQ
jgi:DnaJ-domain-containing protein 1